MNWPDLYLLIPVGVVLGAALIVVFLDLALAHKDRYVLPWIAVTGCMLGLIAVVQTQGLLDRAPWFHGLPQLARNTVDPLILKGAFALDQFGLCIWMISCAAGALAVLASPQPSEEDSVLSSGEYYGLILLAVAGMMLLAVSHDFLTLLISLEIMSISTYILAGSSRDDLRSNEAAMKYLVLGAFSTAFLLLGIAFYYGAFGSLSLAPSQSFENLPPAEQMPRMGFAWLALGLLLVGTLFKIGAAPFHFWIPDVYQGAPTGITGLMAVGVKAAGFAVVARLVFEAFGHRSFRNDLVPLLGAAAMLTMIIGNILAMRQSNLKRLLAYSGIAHTGYLLLALLIQSGGDPGVIGSHLRSVIFYLMVYGVMTLGAFGVISLLREDGKPMEEMDDYKGLAKEHPGIAICMGLFMLSLAGMPPTAGFFAKFMIFRGAIEEGQIVPAVVGILTSVASLYYYLRVIVVMFMSPANETSGAQSAQAVRCQYAWGPHLLILITGIATLLIGILPGWFY